MPRTIQPELLDSLPPHHPDARHNRRDLRLTNRFMGNYRWFARTLPPRLRAGDRILELGAGTGELSSHLRQVGVHVEGLDLWPTPDNWPESLKWHRADLRTFDGYDRYSVVIGNLIFHQFSDAELAALGATLRAKTRLILACEPARQRSSQVFYRLFGRLLGANHVSLHDAHVSIDAGFVGDELPRALDLPASEWTIHYSINCVGAYRMTAVRRE